MNYLDLAIRNIKRHRKRSVVTIFTICLGFTALGVIGGILSNIFSRLKEQAVVNEKLGHLTLAKEGFFKNGKMTPEDYLWNETELNQILKELKEHELVAIATPRLNLMGVISNGRSSTIFLTEAIVPADDEQLIKTTIDGRTERSAITLNQKSQDQSYVAIGSELAENLNLKKDESLTLLVSTKDGIANATDVIISEVYNTGNPAINDKFILSNFYMAQELYDTKGAERIVITLKDPDQIEKFRSEITERLAKLGYKTEIKSWKELSLTYGKVKKMFGVIFRVLTIIITVIVLLTLLNTMQMAVNERTREIGTIRAMGILKRHVVKLFCFEGIVMGLIGCLFAIPILLTVAFILKMAGITFIPPVASTEVPVNLILKAKNIIPVFILFMVSSILSSFIASRKIAGQKIVTSLSQIN